MQTHAEAAPLIGWAFVPTGGASHDPHWRPALWDGREWTSEPVGIAPARALVLSWNALTPHGVGISFDIALLINGAWTVWTPIGAWGAAPHAEAVDSPIKVNVDTASWEGMAGAVSVRAWAWGTEPVGLKRIVVASARAVEDKPCAGPPTPGKFIQKVTFRSQMAEPPEIRARICGPTCVAMHLASVAPDLPTSEVAALSYDPVHDLYGNWPRLAAVAGERGFVAWVEQFSCLRQVEERLLAGYGAILSVAFEEGELAGAAIPRSDGHLLVLRGWDERGGSICNDPAFPDGRGAAVRYRRDQLERVWSGHGGATIVLRRERAP